MALGWRARLACQSARIRSCGICIRSRMTDDERGPRVLGVDDVALRRKQRRYGTLLIDLETHRPIDLLDDRTADVFANWLRCHPGVEIIVRDRAGAYAEGGRQGAPDAIQVADRFHLAPMLAPPWTRSCAAVDATSNTWSSPNLPSRSARRRRRQCHRRAKHNRTWPSNEHAAAHAGTRCVPDAPPGTASRASRARWACTGGPSAAIWPRRCRRAIDRPEHPKPSGLTSPTLQPFVEYLQGRWQAGCTNVAQLQRELEAQGYQGSYSLLMQALQPWRGPRPPPEPGRGRRRGRPRIKRVNVRWLCLRPPDQLEPHELDALQDILDGDERLALGYELLQRFRRLIARRSVRDLDQWLEDAADQRAPSVRQPLAWHSGGSRRGRQRIDAALVDRTRGRHSDRSQVAQAPGLWPRLHSAPATTHHQRSLTHLLGAR